MATHEDSDIDFTINSDYTPTNSNSFPQNLILLANTCYVLSNETQQSSPNEEYKEYKSGGTTCCVPKCYNNSKRDKHLSFYVIPKDETLEKKWLRNISRQNFQPQYYHRVCSAHFEGGKKTYMNNVPTIVPKTIKPVKNKPRSTRNSLGLPSPCDNKDSEEVNPNFIDDEPLLPPPVVLSHEEIVDAENKLLKEELDELKRKLAEKNFQNEELKTALQNTKFRVDRFAHNQEHFKFYTGFQDYSIFTAVLKFLNPKSIFYWGSKSTLNEKAENDAKRGRVRLLSIEDEFFLTLVRLRCAFPIEDLAIRFAVSSSTISRILITWFDFLHNKLRSIPIWPTQNHVRQTMPKCFKTMYPNTRVIIDCTEIFTEMPTSYRSQSATFSSYKHHNTGKGLIGIAPNGAITFVSDLYAGRSSDKQITNHCGILNLLQPGDDLMADRGFDIEKDLPDGVTLNIPPFLEGKDQLSFQEELKTRRIASVRIHVERAIERVKNYQILQKNFQLSMAPDLNKIWVICCHLVNFLPPLIATDKD